MQLDPTVTLLQGQESPQKIAALLRLTDIRSDAVKRALTLHYVDGYPPALAYEVADIKQQNFERAQARLIEVYKLCDAIIFNSGVIDNTCTTEGGE